MIPIEKIESLCQHLEAGKSLARHDIGYRLPEVLRQLIEGQPNSLEKIANKFHVEHFELLP